MGDRTTFAFVGKSGTEIEMLHPRTRLQSRGDRHREHRRLHRPQPEVCDDLEQRLRQEQVVHVRDSSRSLPDARLEGEQPGRRLERKGRRARHGQES